MNLNFEDDHIANRVSKFFEIHRVKRPILHLIKEDRSKRILEDPEKPNLQIFGAQCDNRFQSSDNMSLDQKINEMNKSNMDKMISKYPELEQ